MGDKPEQWMLDAARELSALDGVDSDGVEGWEFDPDGWRVRWPEDSESPGWEVWLECSLLTLNAGTVKFESEVSDGLTVTARRLLAAVAGYDGAP